MRLTSNSLKGTLGVKGPRGPWGLQQWIIHVLSRNATGIENAMNKKKISNDNSANKPPKKQMKVFLTFQEHAVVTAAANMRGMQVGSYMKEAVINQAKEDAKEMNKIIESI